MSNVGLRIARNVRVTDLACKTDAELQHESVQSPGLLRELMDHAIVGEGA